MSVDYTTLISHTFPIIIITFSVYIPRGIITVANINCKVNGTYKQNKKEKVSGSEKRIFKFPQKIYERKTMGMMY